MAHRISKVARVYNLGAKGFKTANIAYKAGSSAVRAGGLLIEGTTFNAASKIIRNGIHGRAMLDDMNLNPLAKENLQTAAFLGALSIGKQIAGIPPQNWRKNKIRS